MTAAVAASIDRAFHQLLLYSVLPCAHRFDVSRWERDQGVVAQPDCVSVMAYFRDSFVHLFKFYAVTPEGERDLPLPEPDLPPEVLNTLSVKEVKLWRAFHANSDPTDYVRMRFDAFKRFVQDFKLMTELGLKYKSVTEAFLASAQYPGFAMPLKFQTIHSHQIPIPTGDAADVTGHIEQSTELRKLVAVSLQDRVVLTADQVRPVYRSPRVTVCNPGVLFGQFLNCICRLALLLLNGEKDVTHRQRLKALMQAFSGVFGRGSVTRIMELRSRVCGTKDGLIKAAASFHDRYGPWGVCVRLVARKCLCL